MKMKVVMKAGNIPDFAVVSKKTGEVQYTLRSTLTIYADKDSRPSDAPQVLHSEGVKFIVDERGTINCVPHDKELMWHVPEEELLSFLEERNEPQQ
jgi:hypothetical protein